MGKLPEYQDEVKHKQQDAIGVVIAKYPKFLKDGARWFLDIRLSDNSILYVTPAENWETVHTAEERGQ